jgi:3-phenylpropionate/trans-cinnamate dioxygenase ferredoxin component
VRSNLSLRADVRKVAKERVGMPDFVFAAETEDIAAGRGKTISLGEKRIALFNVDGASYAISDTCLHRGGLLGDGDLEGCVVTCPWHGWRFDVRNVRTGERMLNAAACVTCYQTRTDGGEVQVRC